MAISDLMEGIISGLTVCEQSDGVGSWGGCVGRGWFVLVGPVGFSVEDVVEEVVGPVVGPAVGAVVRAVVSASELEEDELDEDELDDGDVVADSEVGYIFQSVLHDGLLQSNLQGQLLQRLPLDST
jgi:hypothetical protein